MGRKTSSSDSDELSSRSREKRHKSKVPHSRKFRHEGHDKFRSALVKKKKSSSISFNATFSRSISHSFDMTFSIDTSYWDKMKKKDKGKDKKKKKKHK
jgi:hypothetical protein